MFPVAGPLAEGLKVTFSCPAASTGRTRFVEISVEKSLELSTEMVAMVRSTFPLFSNVRTCTESSPKRTPEKSIFCVGIFNPDNPITEFPVR